MNHDELRNKLSYDPITGLFTNRKTGKIIGYNHNFGYISISFQNNEYLAHRLAWYYMRAEWPKEEIDHIDTNKKNNAWSNLRESTYTQNKFNRPVQPNNKLGIKGVRAKRNKFQARIRVGGHEISLGVYNTRDEAANAYKNAALNVQKEFIHKSLNERN